MYLTEFNQKVKVPCADTSVLNDADLSSACNLLVDGVLF